MFKVIKNILLFPFLIIKYIELFLLKFYKKKISPFLGDNCRFYPTCSEYMYQAVDKYGIIKGNIIGIKRILKCNPFCKGGIDYLKWNEECKWLHG